MFEELPLNSKHFYHNILSIIMLVVWCFFIYKGYKTKDHIIKNKISIWIVSFCFIQEAIDFINRIFLDPIYIFSIQRDLPFLQFCQVSFYFSILCLLYTKKEINKGDNYSLNQFLFDASFLLGFSGAFQGILTPDFENINNLIGVFCIQLQHSLILLNVIWLMSAYKYKLQFKGVCLTYLFIVFVIIPIALISNKILGTNSAGLSANYFYANELPKVDNFFLNYAAQYPFPEYILHIQPTFIFYFLILYIPFFILNKYKK